MHFSREAALAIRLTDARAFATLGGSPDNHAIQLSALACAAARGQFTVAGSPRVRSKRYLAQQWERAGYAPSVRAISSAAGANFDPVRHPGCNEGPKAMVWGLTRKSRLIRAAQITRCRSTPRAGVPLRRHCPPNRAELHNRVGEQAENDYKMKPVIKSTKRDRSKMAWARVETGAILRIQRQRK